MNVLPSFFYLFYYNQSPWYAIFAHSIHILSIDLESMNTNHSSNILSTNYIQSVIIPKNHSYTTTKYLSLCTTIENEGIHNKLQFFFHILVIPVAIINSILHATQNKTFHENGNNRIKHCVNQWSDRIVFVWILLVLKQYFVYHMQFALKCPKTDPCEISPVQFLFVTICRNNSISNADLLICYSLLFYYMLSF